MEVAVSKRTLSISTIVLVVLFALTAAARFAVQAFAYPMGYGMGRGFEGFRGQIGPGMMGGFHAPVAYGQGWFNALTSFGMWVFPIMLLGLLIVAIAQSRTPEKKEEAEPKGKSK
jgi:preprotein translocase subunit SecG